MTLKTSLVFRCKLNLKLEMTKERLTRQEEHSENDGTAQLETPNPMDSIMKELVQMRKENKKLHRRLDTIFDAKAKKSLVLQEEASICRS